MIATTLTPPTFPARPRHGVSIDQKLPGTWFWEPKYNGHRALVHVPTSSMWNRHGGKLAIAHEFEEALEELTAIYDWQAGIEWLDCEPMARRATDGKGTIVVLDLIHDKLCYETRRLLLEEVFNEAPLNPQVFPRNSVVIPPKFEDGRALWNALKAWNTGKDSAHWFYEGVVGKRADSLYHVQLSSPENEFSGWIKLRWSW